MENNMIPCRFGFESHHAPSVAPHKRHLFSSHDGTCPTQPTLPLVSKTVETMLSIKNRFIISYQRSRDHLEQTDIKPTLRSALWRHSGLQAMLLQTINDQYSVNEQTVVVQREMNNWGTFQPNGLDGGEFMLKCPLGRTGSDWPLSTDFLSIFLPDLATWRTQQG